MATLDYLKALGLTHFVPKAAQREPVLGVSFALDAETRPFCQAVAKALGLALVEEAAGLHWGQGGDIDLAPHLCLGSAQHKRALWQQLYDAYDAQHRQPS
ncbi:hypothetical protein PVT67_14885 [Gallaecimonas kandeliae]|uniref:hypothetical protein n=1 Tax=Gallaecimonas kandeliae TaxID=3029055 RepID=UPI00264A1771|nr:hypothetical protein [Gallaecimonas kandeliae]WKE64939.1 hypothetical protein PVT67_14885 [Gallaecimonas kandeliae]